MLKFVARVVFRRLLRTRKARRWRDRLTATGQLLGAPAGEEKLRHQFKQNLKWFIKSFITTQQARAKTAGVRVRVRMIAPVRPSKKFLITLTGLPLSVAAAERCLESAKRHGEDHDLEIVPAIDKFQSRDFFTRHGLTWNRRSSNFDPLAGMGCFSSHFKLWLRCMELGEPIVALEHDAVFRAPLPALRFKHVIMLGKPLFLNPSKLALIKAIGAHKQREVFHPWNFLMGTHCYAIAPEGACRLVEAARRQLLPPVDHFICKRYVNILYYHPHPVDLDDRFTTIASTAPGGSPLWQDHQAVRRDQRRGA